jgi:hypothetical protein
MKETFTKRDAAVIKTLAELGAMECKELTPEEEEILRVALDPQEQFYQDIERLFTRDGQ